MLNTRHCKLKQLIYFYDNFNFTIVFLSEKDNFFQDAKSTLWDIPLTWAYNVTQYLQFLPGSKSFMKKIWSEQWTYPIPDIYEQW